MKRKILFITGIRSDFYIQKRLIKAVELHPKLKMYLVVTGAHLKKDFGETIDYIENDNFIQINDKTLKIPKMHLTTNMSKGSSLDVKHALNFNKELLIENFINPNRLRFPLFRNKLYKVFEEIYLI